MKELIQNIESWGESKGILFKDNAYKQLAKATEELGEVAGALLKNQPDELEKEIGDVIVTLTIFAKQNGLDIENCTRAAYEKIKNRSGVTKDGVFIKN